MPGLLRGVARTAVIAGTATSVSNRVSRRQAGRWAEQDALRGQEAGYQAPPPPPAPTTVAPEDEMTNKIAQLKELGDLRSQGVLTQSEFEAQKARILAT
ncbi:SHOCT domain-containing protein [Streptomyces sp. NPDC092952]|uniref:SHOCT domain-containing protein n=1 Tax=Streptomyces sp. NPDC092952 TaxID=3366018 RepID=UPI0037FFEDA8